MPSSSATTPQSRLSWLPIDARPYLIYMRENRSARLYARQSDGEDVALFEGGNPLPFFWLMLLGREDVELYCIRMRRLIAAGTSPSRATLRLDKLRALMQATIRRPYLERHFASWLGLFDDWIYFLQISDFSDMKIYLDLYSVSLYYPTLSQFEDSLLRALDCFDRNIATGYEESIAGTCGHEAHNRNRRRFERFSESYRVKAQDDIYGLSNRRIHLERNSLPNERGRFATLAFLLALITLVIAAIVGLLIIKK